MAHAFEDLSIRRSVVGQSPVVALIPPLWHRLITPKGLAWDRIHATEPERRLAADANARSGMTGFVAAT
ncbi:alkane 1-monooxygenase domain protein [Burkholderia cepacia]|nr:alkane 1-monooxygenase domain protein [Burkholderia cepacia]